MHSRLLLVASTLSLLFALPGQEAIRLRTVPEWVQLPAAAGSNLLLEVEVDGAPDAVWLATAGSAIDRVPLVAGGERRYQCNLADVAVANLLPAGRDQGSLFAFARYGTKVVQSTAIGWARTTAADTVVRCVLRSNGAVTRTASPDKASWVDPATIERIELQGAGSRQATTVARLGDFEQPLVRQADSGLWILDVDAALRERLHASKAFEIEVRQGTTSVLFGFRCVPAKIATTDAPVFPVQQRQRAWVPGSNEWLQVRIDDITMCRVLFELVNAEGAAVVSSRVVRERDSFEFALGQERYVIVVQKLHNLLIGEDHAEFAVRPAAGFEPDLIGRLIHVVEASGDTFLREGKEYDGLMAAQFLVAKLANHRGEPPDVDEFVERFASQSSRSGQPYEVRKKDGTVVTMQEWLRAERRRLATVGDGQSGK